MADDDDYMSDKFILSTEKYTPPGLALKHSDKRAIELTKRKAAADVKMMKKYKSQCIMEQEKREEGLSSAISANNKGFEMIMKMGYRPGQGIGKNPSGLCEPIPMNIKTNRSGLGTIKKAPPMKKLNSSTSKLAEMKTDEFRDRIALKKLGQLMEIDVVKSQKVCEQLDIQSKINEPVEPWYWPPVTVVEEFCDDNDADNGENSKNESIIIAGDANQKESGQVEPEDDCLDNDAISIEIPTATKLENITEYLRKQYAYCIWCGVSYNDQKDLNENCPGNTRSDH